MSFFRFIKFRSSYAKAAYLGTLLEHYDSSLYGFLAPTLTALFLPHLPEAQGLMIMLLAYPMGLLAKPIGAWMLGSVGDRLGRRTALALAMTGVACCTAAIGMLPTYAQIGIWAPCLLMLCRFGMKYFSAGESSGGVIFLLEHSAFQQAGLRSGLFCCATVLGSLVAAFVVLILAYFPTSYWRVAYLLGLLTALGGWYIRHQCFETASFQAMQQTAPPKIGFWDFCRHHHRPLWQAVKVTGCMSALYSLGTFFMVSYVPLVTPIERAEILQMNMVGLLLYMVCVPFSGYAADRLGVRKVMMAGTMLLGVTSIPLFLTIHNASDAQLWLVKIIIALLSAWMLGPFHAWLTALFPTHLRYRGVALSYAIGAQIGGAMPGLCLWMFEKYHYSAIPAWVLLGWALVALHGLHQAGYLPNYALEEDAEQIPIAASAFGE